jgi:hypothetical protein
VIDPLGARAVPAVPTALPRRAPTVAPYRQAAALRRTRIAGQCGSVQAVAGADAPVLACVSRSTHRLAIFDSRLLAIDEHGVASGWKDCRAKGRALHAMTPSPPGVHAPLHVACAARRLSAHLALRATGQRHSPAQPCRSAAVPQGGVDAGSVIKGTGTVAAHDEPQSLESPSLAAAAADRCWYRGCWHHRLAAARHHVSHGHEPCSCTHRRTGRSTADS